MIATHVVRAYASCMQYTLRHVPAYLDQLLRRRAARGRAVDHHVGLGVWSLRSEFALQHLNPVEYRGILFSLGERDEPLHYGGPVELVPSTSGDADEVRPIL